jgi:uncharacterized metal-binding protein
MSEEVKCDCCGANIAIFSCVGSSNVGQLSNKIAIELEKRGLGNLMCTSGIGGRVSGIMKSAEASDKIIVIDGCPLNCGRNTLELAGFKVDNHIIISEFGIKKNKDKDLKENEISKALEKTLEILQLQ